jgi:anti-anti-sigma factor
MDGRSARLAAEPILALKERVEGARLVLVLSGEFDLAGERQARTVLNDAMCGPARSVVLDMRELAFMDLAGVRWLRRAKRSAVHVGKHLAVLPSDATTRILDLIPDWEVSLGR